MKPRDHFMVGITSCMLLICYKIFPYAPLMSVFMIWFATNLWATYDRDHGERLVDITTYDDYDTYDQYKARGEKMSRPDYWLVEDHRRLCVAHPSDIEANS